MIIKESEIRNYVRGLIREALESEGREVLITPEERAADLAEREKMLAGLPYDRSKFPYRGKSDYIERQLRIDRGLPPIRRPKGGVIPRLIDGDGNDVTPENSPEEIAARLEGRKTDHREKMGKRFIKKADRKSIVNGRNLSDDEAEKLTVDKFANDAENDPWTQKWFAMTPEEQEAERERIRRERNQKGIDNNAALRREWQNNQVRPESPKTRQDLLDRLAEFKKKQTALGPHCQANDKKWKYYESFIKDTQRIIDRYYGGKKIKKKSNDEENSVKYDDEMLNGILASGPDAATMASEIGDKYIDPYSFRTNVNDVDKNEHEEEEEDRGGNSDFDGAIEMGLFNDDDDYMDM